MPIVRIQIARGRTDEQKKHLLQSVTDAIHESMGVPLSTIHVMLQEIPSDAIMIGGELLSEKPEPSDE
jgi:4-oxalocrotonate tautomerase